MTTRPGTHCHSETPRLLCGAKELFYAQLLREERFDELSAELQEAFEKLDRALGFAHTDAEGVAVRNEQARVHYWRGLLFAATGTTSEAHGEFDLAYGIWMQTPPNGTDSALWFYENEVRRHQLALSAAS